MRAVGQVHRWPPGNSACSNTVFVATFCRSGGYPYLRRIRFTRPRNQAPPTPSYQGIEFLGIP